MTTNVPQFHEINPQLREALRPLEDFRGITLPQLWGEARSALQSLDGKRVHDQIEPLRFLISGQHSIIPKVEQLDGKLWGEVVGRTLLQIREPDRLLPLLVGLARYTSRPWTGSALVRAATTLMGLHQLATLLFQLGGAELLAGLDNPAKPAQPNVVLDEKPETTSLGADGVQAVLQHLPAVVPGPAKPAGEELAPPAKPAKPAKSGGLPAGTARSRDGKIRSKKSR